MKRCDHKVTKPWHEWRRRRQGPDPWIRGVGRGCRSRFEEGAGNKRGYFRRNCFPLERGSGLGKGWALVSLE